MEPNSGNRYTSMLLGSPNGRFRGEVQNGIESSERDVHRFEKQTGFEIPDIMEAGVLMNGLEEEGLRRHGDALHGSGHLYQPTCRC